jgi:hypothetical protein
VSSSGAHNLMEKQEQNTLNIVGRNVSSSGDSSEMMSYLIGTLGQNPVLTTKICLDQILNCSDMVSCTEKIILILNQEDAFLNVAVYEFVEAAKRDAFFVQHLMTHIDKITGTENQWVVMLKTVSGEQSDFCIANAVIQLLKEECCAVQPSRVIKVIDTICRLSNSETKQYLSNALMSNCTDLKWRCMVGVLCANGDKEAPNDVRRVVFDFLKQ